MNIELSKLSTKIKKNILKMAFCAGSSSAHIGGALSLSDFISVIYRNLKVGKDNKISASENRIILSKGHACLAYYSALYEIGKLTADELETFEKNGSFLLGHPIKNLNKGIDFSTGSLGMGLSIGIGVSIAYLKKKKNNKIIVIMGDGECNEGSVWEAAMSASHYKLNNLICFVDHNHYQQTGTNEDIMSLGSLNEKWKSFGWDVVEIDGHNFDEILKAIDIQKSEKPRAIIGNTIKGKGVSFIENNNTWHHNILTKSKYEEALKELEND